MDPQHHDFATPSGTEAVSLHLGVQDILGTMGGGCAILTMANLGYPKTSFLSG